MPPWALVCTFMCRTLCELMFLEYPVFTLRYQLFSVVRGMGLLDSSLWPPSVLANCLVMEWGPMPFSPAALALISLPPCHVCMLSTLSSREHVAPHCAVVYISPMSKDGKCLLMFIGHLCLTFGEMSFKLGPIKNRFAFLLPASSPLWIPIIDLYQI